MSRNCYTCRAPLGKWDTSGDCAKCRDAAWRARSAPTRVPASREVLEHEVRELWDRKVREAHREHVVVDALTRASFHEAAHCVTALALGLTVESVSIGTTRGEVGAGGTSVSGWTDRTAQLAEVALAGAIGERRFIGDVSDGCGHDERRVREAWEAGYTPDSLLIRSIVELNAGAVKAVAQALLEHGTLSSGDLDAVLRTALPVRPVRQMAEAEARFSGEVESRTTVGLLGRPRPVAGEIRHGTWVEYDPELPPDGRSRAWVDAWNGMHRAGDAGNWPLFRALQDRLVTE